VFATARDVAAAPLKALSETYPGRLVILQLDSTNEETIKVRVRDRRPTSFSDIGCVVCRRRAREIHEGRRCRPCCSRHRCWQRQPIRSVGQFCWLGELSLTCGSTASDFKTNFETNVVGSFLAIREFLPFLERSTASQRTLNVLSTAAASIAAQPQVGAQLMATFKLDSPPLLAYGTSKVGLLSRRRAHLTPYW
jgi:NAD(P)-dependent dehydrogenase (short-subunit alcohol dehydrogenase family)